MTVFRALGRFPPKASRARLCRDAYLLSPGGSGLAYVMLIQPSKRGAWCREDRKKSYRLGDLAVVVVRLGEKGFDVVGSRAVGAKRDSHLEVMLDAGQRSGAGDGAEHLAG